MLGPIQGFVCTLEYRLAAVTRLERRDPDGGGDGYRLAPEVERTVGNGQSQFFEQRQAHGRRSVRDQQDKLFTAEPGDKITRAQLPAELIGNDLEHFVACQMPITIIDPLEMVEIEHGDQQRVALCLPACDCKCQPLAPGRPIGQTGQGIEQGFLPLLFQVLAKVLGLLLHLHHPLGQCLQVCCDVLLARITLPWC